jgi:hypothetical protein
MGAGPVGGTRARPPGQMGGRAHRGVRQRDPRSRQSYDGASGARRDRAIYRARRFDGGQSRRLFVRERPGQLDQFAGDPVSLRRRNLIAEWSIADAIPPISMTRRRRRASLSSRPVAAAARGRLRGLGIGCFLETARGQRGCRNPDGRVSLLLGTQSNGQGHETSYPQIPAMLLGLPIEAFRLVQADTRAVNDGAGHGGARTMHQGGAALVKAAEAVIEKGRPIAAALLQADITEVAFSGGRFTVRGDGTRDRPSRVSPCRDRARRPPRQFRWGQGARSRQLCLQHFGRLHLSERLPHRRRRNRPGDRICYHRAVYCGRRLRAPDQPEAD